MRKAILTFGLTTFDRKLTEIFGIESEIAKEIADALRVKIDHRREASLGRQIDKQSGGLRRLSTRPVF